MRATERRLPGTSLTEADFAALENSWIDGDLATRALLRRVDTTEGQALVGAQGHGDYSGIAFPYLWPGEDHVREYRLRRDHPDFEYKDGRPKQTRKYLGPPGKGNLLYFAPDTNPAWLEDTSIPVVITEGEKKALALHRLACQSLATAANRPPFLAIGLSGVWNWRGTVGKTSGPSGDRVNVKGPIPDLGRIPFRGRRVYIVFDSNAKTNRSVGSAQAGLARELTGRESDVRTVEVPAMVDESAINGIDDLLTKQGPEKVLALIQQTEPVGHRGKQDQAQQLCELAETAELFRTPNGDGYALVPVIDHFEVWAIKSSGFRQWLKHKFYQEYRKPPKAQPLQDALGILEARAQFDSPVQDVFVRVAGCDTGKIYIDLCNEKWEVVEISPDRWRVVAMANTTVRFRRPKGLQPLPSPRRGRPLTSLKDFINIGNDENWILAAAWLVAACRPRGPYPILILQGEQGSAKTSFARFLRAVIDPSVAPVRTPPRTEEDLLIAATNSWVVAFDNISAIPAWLSDALCRLATGGGYSTRELYYNSEQVFFEASRPVILNGIDHLAERPDLADRALILNLPSIPSAKRRDERSLNSGYEGVRPEIFGALLDAVVIALTELPKVVLDEMPRMADFAEWATAAATGLGLSPERFMDAYRGNREDSIENTLETDAVAIAIRKLMEGRIQWTGPCKELLTTLDVDEVTRKSPAWPQTPRAMSNRVRRLATFFRETGIEIKFPPRVTKGPKGMRRFTITKIPIIKPEFTATTATSATSGRKAHSQAGLEPGPGGGPMIEVAVDGIVADGPPPTPETSNSLKDKCIHGLAHPGGGSGGRFGIHTGGGLVEGTEDGEREVFEIL